MDHIAILSPKQHVLEKLLSAEKTIETRWYKHEIAPWGKISVGDIVYFKNAGKAVTATATVSNVIEIIISSPEETLRYIHQYKDSLGFSPDAWQSSEWLLNKRYGLLIFLSNTKEVAPFFIDKKGFGSACAWLCIPNIESIIKF